MGCCGWLMATKNIRLEATKVSVRGNSIGEKDWRFIVDTGSNVSLMHHAHPEQLGGKAKIITFHNKTDPHHSGHDVPVSIQTRPRNEDGKQFVLKGMVSFVNLRRAIPSFPMSSRQGLIGTNLLWGRRVQVTRDKCMRILHRGCPLPPGFVEIEGVVPCVDLQKKDLGPLLTVRMAGSERVFLVDTGNLRSTFCVTKGLCGLKRKCGNVCTATIALKDGQSVEAEGDVLDWQPQSLVNIPCGPNRKLRPSGNLGLDVWIGLFESTIFDFGPKGSMDHKIFCKLPNKKGRSRVSE